MIKGKILFTKNRPFYPNHFPQRDILHHALSSFPSLHFQFEVTSFFTCPLSPSPHRPHVFHSGGDFVHIVAGKYYCGKKE